jgi:hypothetical protein
VRLGIPGSRHANAGFGHSTVMTTTPQEPQPDPEVVPSGDPAIIPTTEPLEMPENPPAEPEIKPLPDPFESP